MTKRGTIGSCRCSLGQTIRMGAIVPHSDKKAPSAGRSTWLWVFIGVAFLLCLILFLQHQMESNAREKARREQERPVNDQEEGSPMVHFGRENILVENRWSLFAGVHPTVTFRCCLDKSAPRCRRAVLCYRPLGEEVWNTVDASMRRGSAQIKLRDLYRDMPYECFFVIVTRDTLFHSATIRFET